MVKGNASPFPTHNSRRFALKHNNFKAKVSIHAPPANSQQQDVLMNTISLLQDEWAVEFRNDLTGTLQSQISTEYSPFRDASFMDIPSNALVPQSFWDDLFDKALTALNTAPMEEDCQNMAT